MSKKSIKQILYLWLVVVIFGCSSPEFLLEDQKNSNQSIKMEILNPETIKKHPRLFTKISKHNDVILLKSTDERNASSSVYNFTINTNLCKMITVDSIVTYTFYVMREQNNELFENLVLREKPDGTYLAKLMQYNITETEKQQILNGVDIDLNNKISSIIINDSDFISDITGKIYYSGSLCYQADIVVVPPTPCVNGHTDPLQCDLRGSGAPQPGGTQVVYTPVDCGGGGGSGPPDDGGGLGGGSGPSSPTGPGLPIFEDDDSPCKKLINGTKNLTYKQKFKNLNKQEKFDLDVETGFAQKKENGLLNYFDIQVQTSHSLSVPTGSLNFTHVHTNNITTNLNGDTYDKHVKILSPKDIGTLIYNCQDSAINNNLDPTNAFGVMISNEGVFAITLLDPLTPSERGDLNQKFNKMQKDYNKLSNKILIDQDLDSDGRKLKLQKMLLLLLKDYGLQNKIGLFEGVVQENDNIKWTKKELNPSNPNNNLVEKPC